jgi:hypothetical protein
MGSAGQQTAGFGLRVHDVVKSGDDPYRKILATFGYKLNINFIKKKTSSYIFGYGLEPGIKIWRLFYI